MIDLEMTSSGLPCPPCFRQSPVRIFWEMSSRCLRLLRFILSVSTCSELTFSFVAFVRDAIAASSFLGSCCH